MSDTNSLPARLNKVLHSMVDTEDYVGLSELATMLRTGEWEDMAVEQQELLLEDYEEYFDIEV